MNRQDRRIEQINVFRFINISCILSTDTKTQLSTNKHFTLEVYGSFQEVCTIQQKIDCTCKVLFMLQSPLHHLLQTSLALLPSQPQLAHQVQ